MKLIKNEIGKIRGASNLFFAIACFFLSCNNSLNDKYQKIFRAHPTIISNTLPDYYLNLFQQRVRDKIKLITSFEHIGRDTVCDFLYDGKYYISLYTLSRSFNASLQTSLKENVSEINEELGTPFYDNQIGRLYIKHRFSITDDDKPLNIYISLEGSALSKKVKNDGFVDYFFKCKNLSIKYKISGHQEVYLETDGSIGQSIPIETIFIKSKKRLFLIFLTPKKDSASYPSALGTLLFKSG
ncbi:MAG: hypothetical protein ACHQF4_10695 [Sphingobacteriales bacterium]